jgi:hypothetical protein
MPLLVLPIPSRWDGRSEVDESREWLTRFAETLGNCYGSWLPTQYTPRQMLERTKVPHVAHFSFGEKLPALTHGTSDSELPGYAYDAYASLIAREFKNAGDLLGQPQGQSESKSAVVSAKDGYEFDVYISYRRDSATSLWLTNHFLPMFGGALGLELGRDSRTFTDIADVASGSAWPNRLNSALQHSTCLIAILSASYFRSDWCLRELWTFIERERQTDTLLIIPATIHGGATFPSYIQQRQLVDLRNYLITATAFAQSARF